MKKLIFLTVIISTLFSCNKKDDPQPTSKNNGTTPTPNTAPTVSATPSSSTNPTTITINATDADGTISKVEVFNGSILLTTLTTSPYIYTLPTLTTASYTYTVKATDNSNAISSTSVSFTVSSTTTPKTDTETLLNNFMNKTLSFINGGQFMGTLTISSTAMTASQTQPVNEFFGGAIATSSYTVDADGNVIMNGITYSVSTTTNNTVLVLTKLTGGGQTYRFEYSSPKDITVATLSSFYGTVNGLYNPTTISSTSFTTTATQPSGGFFIGAASAGTYNYTVLSNGNIQFVAGAYTIEYSVQVSSGYLVLTNVNNSSQDNIYTLYK